jgi:hypothetical protein
MIIAIYYLRWDGERWTDLTSAIQRKKAAAGMVKGQIEPG